MLSDNQRNVFRNLTLWEAFLKDSNNQLFSPSDWNQRLLSDSKSFLTGFIKKGCIHRLRMVLESNHPFAMHFKEIAKENPTLVLNTIMQTHGSSEWVKTIYPSGIWQTMSPSFIHSSMQKLAKMKHVKMLDQLLDETRSIGMSHPWSGLFWLEWGARSIDQGFNLDIFKKATYWTELCDVKWEEGLPFTPNSRQPNPPVFIQFFHSLSNTVSLDQHKHKSNQTQEHFVKKIERLHFLKMPWESFFLRERPFGHSFNALFRLHISKAILSIFSKHDRFLSPCGLSFVMSNLANTESLLNHRLIKDYKNAWNNFEPDLRNYILKGLANEWVEQSQSAGANRNLLRDWLIPYFDSEIREETVSFLAYVVAKYSVHEGFAPHAEGFGRLFDNWVNHDKLLPLLRQVSTALGGEENFKEYHQWAREVHLEKSLSTNVAVSTPKKRL